MTIVELLPQGATANNGRALPVSWPATAGARGDRCVIGVDPWLTTWGAPRARAIDLARVAIAAMLADQLVRRSATHWTRELSLVVHVVDPSGFEPAVELVELLLMWLSGDEWSIQLVRDTTKVASRPVLHDPAPQVSLLSGGLDSLCGAALAPAETVFFGHSDNTAVRHAQNTVRGHLAELHGDVEYRQAEVRALSDRKKERSTRSRSFLFMALAAALADARGAKTVAVPENGFTSLNPPIAANRGGPHTTRSTHPTTFAYANEIVRTLGLDVRFENPFEWRTKSQVIRLAAGATGTAWLRKAIPDTYSCATQNTQWYRGGDPNLNCGICVACMTRRGAIRTARLVDHSEYIVDRLVGNALEKFLRERGTDVVAVRACSGWKPDLAFVCAMGPHASDFDYNSALGLLQSGVKELVRGLPN